MGLIAIPNVFAQRTTAKASEVNANFSEIASKFNASAVLTDVARTITVLHTFGAGLTVSAGTTALQALTATSIDVSSDMTIANGKSFFARRNTGSAAITCFRYDAGTDDLSTLIGGPIWRIRDTGAGVPMSLTSAGLMTLAAGLIINAGGLSVGLGGFAVNAGGMAVVGNSTITGTLGGITGLTVGGAGITVSAGGINISAGGLTVTGGIAGTLSTAAQPNITSVGILAAPHLTSPVVDSGGLTVSAGGATMTGTVAVTGRIVVSAHGMFGAWDGTGDAGSLGVSNNTTTTATAGAQSLPASPAGFLSWRLGAASIKVPYYNA